MPTFFRTLLKLRPRDRSRSHGFSLIELLTVVSVISVLAGLGVPAIKGLTGSNGLNTGARKMADWMNVARSEAISRRTVVRFAVAREWKAQDGREDASLRKISLWAWNGEFERFMPLTKWEELPLGVVIEPSLPDYVFTANYANENKASVQGDCVLEPKFASDAEFNAGTDAEPIPARFIEFLASGSMRIPGGKKRHAVFIATQGFVNPTGGLTYTNRGAADSDRIQASPAKWAQVNVDTLTGRIRVYQP